MNDYDECVYSLDPGDADTDDDGLTDGQELYKLGTDGGEPDTDGDVITDTLEVEGFVYPDGRQPGISTRTNPDTNNDGLIDSVECPRWWTLPIPLRPTSATQCDSDQDGIPNLFEFDNDNDGVPDRVDLSPDEWVDLKGKRTGQVTDPTPFDGDNPFTLTVHEPAGQGIGRCWWTCRCGP